LGFAGGGRWRRCRLRLQPARSPPVRPGTAWRRARAGRRAAPRPEERSTPSARWFPNESGSLARPGPWVHHAKADELSQSRAARLLLAGGQMRLACICLLAACDAGTGNHNADLTAGAADMAESPDSGAGDDLAGGPDLATPPKVLSLLAGAMGGTGN